MEIKDILIRERKRHNLTQEELAKLLFMTRGAYAKYETGKNIPTTENIIKLADLYKCSTDYLLGRYSMEPRPEEKTTKSKNAL